MLELRQAPKSTVALAQVGAVRAGRTIVPHKEDSIPLLVVTVHLPEYRAVD